MMTALELLEFKEAKQNYHFEKLAMEAVECIIGAGQDGKTEIPAGITGAVEWKGLCPAAPRRWQRKKRAGARSACPDPAGREGLGRKFWP
jgi:hypothetical protein